MELGLAMPGVHSPGHTAARPAPTTSASRPSVQCAVIACGGNLWHTSLAATEVAVTCFPDSRGARVTRRHARTAAHPRSQPVAATQMLTSPQLSCPSTSQHTLDAFSPFTDTFPSSEHHSAGSNGSALSASSGHSLHHSHYHHHHHIAAQDSLQVLTQTAAQPPATPWTHWDGPQLSASPSHSTPQGLLPDLDSPGASAHHVHRDRERHARKLTSKLQDCNTWHQVLATLRRYAAVRGSLPPATDTSQAQGASSTLDMPEPGLLLQPLNPRHLVVLWCTLARVVQLGDEQPVGVFRPQGSADADSPHASEAMAAQHHTSVTDTHSPSHTAEGLHSGVEPAPGSSRGPLTRVDLVCLRRLLAKLEQLSWQCMADHSWRPTDAVSTLWAMAHIGHTPGAADSRWLDTWLSFTQTAIPDLSARHLANATWALATTGLRPTPQWVSAATQSAVHLAATDQLTPSGHAVVIWSLARLAAAADQQGDTHNSTAYQPGSPGQGSVRPAHDSLGLAAQDLAELLRHALRNLDSMQPHHVSMMAWAVGHLASAQHPSVQTLRQPGSGSAHPAASTPYRHTDSWDNGSYSSPLRERASALWETVKQLGPQALGPQGTANTLWAAARISQHSSTSSQQGQDSRSSHATSHNVIPPGTVQRLVEDSLPVLPHMTPQQLYTSAWAVATMQAAPSPAWVHALLVSARSQLESFDMQGLSGLLWACCKLGVKPGPAWMTAMLRVVDRKLSQLCPQSVALLLWTLAALGFNPGLQWAKSVTQHTTRLVPQMGAHAAAMCVHALAHLRVPAHPAWSKAMLARTLELMRSPQASTGSDMQAQYLSACLQGVARLGLHPGSSWLAAAEQLIHSWAQRNLAAGVATQQPTAMLGSRQLAGCLYGLARLGHTATESVAETAASQLMQSVQAMQQLDSHSAAVDLAQGCWALAVLGHTPAPAQLQQLTQLTHSLLPAMGHAELAQCVWGLQRMGMSAPPDAAWLDTLLRVSEAQLAVLSTPHQPADNVGAQRLTAPLLSVATLLRALVQWGCTPAQVPSSWIMTAAAVVEAEAGRRLFSSEGALPPASQLSCDIPLHRAAGVATSTLLRSLSPSPPAQPQQQPAAGQQHSCSSSQDATDAQPVSQVVLPSLLASSIPFSVEAGRLATLADASVRISRKAARQRLWRGHRMYVLQHHKVLEASRRALRQLLTSGHGNLTAPLSICLAAQAPDCGSSMSSSDSGPTGESCGGVQAGSWDESREQQFYDGVMGDERDLRFMPW